MKKVGVLCQSCGIEAPVTYVEFYQNIGALVMRFHKSVKGRLCKRCVHKYYWSMTGTTLAIGWLGYLSLLIAPFIIIANTVHYVMAAFMPRVPKGARVPVVTNEIAAKLDPYLQQIFDRLNANEDFGSLAIAMAPSIGVTPGELVTYVVMVAEHQRQQAYQQRMYQQQAALQQVHGFPVVMPPPVAAAAPAR